MEPTRAVIRPAVPSDLTRIRALVFDALAEHGIEPDRDGRDADLVTPEPYFGCGGLLEVLVDPELVGVSGVAVSDGRTAELRKLYLAPRVRGSGWGARLLRRAIEHARRAGCERLVLSTSPRMERAVQFYLEVGFVRSEGAAGDRAGEIGMSLDLC